MKWELSAAETVILKAVEKGEVADLKGESVRAEVVRDIAFSRIENVKVSAFGLRIHHGLIQGQLNLDSCFFNFPLVLTSVEFVDPADAVGLCMRDAYIKYLNLHNVTIAGAFVAERATFENGLIAEEIKVSGPVVLDNARSGHAISIVASSIGDGCCAIASTNLHAEGSMTLRESKFSGAVQLPQLRLDAGLYAEDCEIKLKEDKSGLDTGPQVALDLESACVVGDLLLDNAIVGASIKMDNARVAGQIQALDFQVVANGGSWNMVGINVAHSLCIERAQIKGVLNLTGAEIGKLLVANHIRVDGGETAIRADLIRLGGNFEMTYARLLGTIRCPGANIRGQLRLTKTKIYGVEVAIRGDGSQIGGGCFMSRSFIVGLVRFPASKIGNQFRLRGAILKVESGAALLASGSIFTRNLELNAGFETIGAIILDQAEIVGVCDLQGSRLRSASIARLAMPVNDTSTRLARSEELIDQTVLSMVDARIGRLQMPALGDERPRGIVNFSRAHISAYEDWASTWPAPFKRRIHNSLGQDIDHLVLDGLVYDHLVNPAGISDRYSPRNRARAGKQRIKWLDGQKRADTLEQFRPQPWVQLSKRLAEQGLASDARHIVIQYRRRERRSHALKGFMRWESRLLDWMALYGFNPWRTVFVSVVFFLLFTGAWTWAASRCSTPGCFEQQVFVMSNVDAYRTENFDTLYPPFSAAGYALDNLVPFLSLGYSNHWRPNVNYGFIATLTVPNIPVFLTGQTDKQLIFTTLSITLGGLMYILVVLQKLIGIVLVALITTGFAGILRNES